MLEFTLNVVCFQTTHYSLLTLCTIVNVLWLAQQPKEVAK